MGLPAFTGDDEIARNPVTENVWIISNNAEIGPFQGVIPDKVLKEGQKPSILTLWRNSRFPGQPSEEEGWP